MNDLPLIRIFGDLGSVFLDNTVLFLYLDGAEVSGAGARHELACDEDCDLETTGVTGGWVMPEQVSSEPAGRNTGRFRRRSRAGRGRGTLRHMVTSDEPASERKRFDVIAKGPTVLSSHDEPQPAAEAAKTAALTQDTPVEVWDHEIQRIIFRARGGIWRWITR